MIFQSFSNAIFGTLLKLKVIRLLDDLFDSSLQLDRINYARMVLIPRKGAIKVGDFRPISLLNAPVKIILKVLANRLRGVLGERIEDHQSDFLKGSFGRSMMESIVMAQEVIQFTKRNRIPGYLLKLDFEKAYDMVDWECIIESLRASGFCPKWLSWIKCSLVPQGSHC